MKPQGSEHRLDELVRLGIWHLKYLRGMIWCVTVIVIVYGILILVGLNADAAPAGIRPVRPPTEPVSGLEPICHPADLYAETEVVYDVAQGNTAVKLRVDCMGEVGAEWYLGFFLGDHPTLWEWYAIQNAAGDLLRGRQNGG